jgi:hypothetical protein
MGNDEEFAFAMLVIVVGLFAFAGGVVVSSSSVKENTVKLCIEKPVECKILYDYYKLSENKNND